MSCFSINNEPIFQREAIRPLTSHSFFPSSGLASSFEDPPGNLIQTFIIDTIKEQVENNSILLYMKGSPNQPQCGFSARTVQALMACGERFAYVDVLSNPEIRANLPAYANWPTFPQLWVGGELVGGCDIVTEMYESGELQTLIKETVAAQAG